jgi:hypothetical protein
MKPVQNRLVFVLIIYSYASFIFQAKSSPVQQSLNLSKAGLVKFCKEKKNNQTSVLKGWIS